MPENNDHNSLPSESFGKMRNDSEGFGNVPKGSEGFRTVRNDAERKENHSLTVREVVRLFETAGVARTERSVTNWCQPNKTGIARLDSYFDPNERKYYITPQSVELAIAEEKAKAAKVNDAEAFGKIPQGSEGIRTVPNDGETSKATPASTREDSRVLELERENIDLKITNRAKDIVIGQIQKEREGFFEQLITASRKVGELETKLLQLEGAKGK